LQYITVKLSGNFREDTLVLPHDVLAAGTYSLQQCDMMLN